MQKTIFLLLKPPKPNPVSTKFWTGFQKRGPLETRCQDFCTYAYVLSGIFSAPDYTKCFIILFNSYLGFPFHSSYV